MKVTKFIVTLGNACLYLTLVLPRENGRERKMETKQTKAEKLKLLLFHFKECSVALH